MKNRILTAAALLALCATGCYNNNKEDLYPAKAADTSNHALPACDTANVTYSATIAPIVKEQCAYGSCHVTQGYTGIPMDDYGGVKVIADDGRLMGSIRHQQGYSEMPLAKSMLDSCTIRKFAIWVQNGAKND